MLFVLCSEAVEQGDDEAGSVRSPGGKPAAGKENGLLLGWSQLDITLEISISLSHLCYKRSKTERLPHSSAIEAIFFFFAVR